MITNSKTSSMNLTVTMTICKGLWRKRLKIGVIKEQQRKHIEEPKIKLNGKIFCVLRYFCPVTGNRDKKRKKSLTRFCGTVVRCGLKAYFQLTAFSATA